VFLSDQYHLFEVVVCCNMLLLPSEYPVVFWGLDVALVRSEPVELFV